MNNTIDEKTIENILAIHDKYKSCYFWTSNGNAASRRRQEERDSNQLEFTFQDDEYKIDQSISISCRNVYYSLGVWRNGQKKDVRALKGLLKDMMKAGE